VVRSPAGGDIPEIVAEERDPRRRTEDEEWDEEVEAGAEPEAF
jgi:hypothetical protein